MVGLLADGRALLNRAKTEAANYRQFCKTGIPGTVPIVEVFYRWKKNVF